MDSGGSSCPIHTGDVFFYGRKMELSYVRMPLFHK